MNLLETLSEESTGYLRWRLLRGYVLSRRLLGYWLAILILLGLVAWGGEWGERHAPTTLRLLVFLLSMATSSLITVSLWSPFGETERSAGTWLPPGRIFHLLVLLIMTFVVNQIALELWTPLGDPTRWDIYVLRHLLALTGIALLSAKTFDTRVSWVVPAIVAMSGLVMGYVPAASEGRDVSFFNHSATHLMLRPDDSMLAAAVAVGLFFVGVVAVVWRGEHLTEPEDAAG